MKKLSKVLALLLAMIMLVALPMEASAAARVTASTSARNQAKIKTVKRGKTTVTVIGGGSKKLTTGLVKFTAPASKTYKITLSNLHKYKRKTTQDILVGGASFLKKSTSGRVSGVTFRQNEKRKENLLLMGSAKAAYYNSGKVTSNTPLKTRTANIRLRKGETLYVILTNIEGTARKTCRLCYDVTIR